MDCIYCGKPTQVVNSRQRKQTNDVWRRRQCTDCGSIFTTTEHAELSGGFMVRHKTFLEPLSRDKLFLSIYESCKHRSSALADGASVTKIILSEIVPRATDAAIARDDIVRTAHKILQRLDPATATFYAAYHKLPPAGH